MAAPKATHEVVHPKLQMSVGGKLQRIPVGTPLVLTEAQVQSLGAKVKPIGEKETIDLTGGKKPEKMNVEELTAVLGEAGIDIPDGSKKKDLIALLEGAE